MHHAGEDGADAATVRRVFIAILLTVLVVGARAPFLGQMLVGEEGSFAALVASKTPSSQIMPNHMPQMFIGEVRGHPMFYPFQHNIVPYVLLERGGGALVRAQHLEAATPERIEVGVRLSYLAFFAVGVAGLLWMAAQSISKALVGAFALTTPLAVGASIQPQIDGSTGVFLLGLACVALLAGANRFRIAAPIVAGFLIGLARHEYALAFGGAVVVLAVLQRLFSPKLQTLPWLFAAGLALGVLTSIMVSPSDYWDGISTMTRVYGSSRRFDGIVRQIRFIWPVLLMAAIVSLALLSQLRHYVEDRPAIVLIVGGSLGIVLGFAVSGWSGDGFPRYYAPPLIGLAYAFAAMDRPTLSKRFSMAVGAIALVVFAVDLMSLVKAHHAGVSISSMPDANTAGLMQTMQKDAERSRANHVIVLEQAGAWLYQPAMEFITFDMGAPGAVLVLRKQRPQDVSRFRAE